MINSVSDNINDCPKAIYARRFGKARLNSPKPLKIFFNNKRDFQIVLRNKTKLANEFGLIVKNDLSPGQIEYAKNLYSELNKRVKNGEKNLKMYYYNGVPKIVDVKKTE